MAEMNLMQKWHAMMNETEAIEKDTSVGFGKSSYRAVGEAAVLNVVKPLLKKYKLIVFPVDIQSQEIVNTILTSKGEATRAITQLIVTWQIVDTESGEKMEMKSIGNGADPQDKGSGKAMTYAYKVLFQKSLMLFSGEDTDLTHSDKIVDNSIEKITEMDVKVIEAMVKKIPEATVESIEKWQEVDKLADLSIAQYDKVVRFLQKKMSEQNDKAN